MFPQRSCVHRRRELQEPFSAGTTCDTPEIRFLTGDTFASSSVSRYTYRSLYILLETLNAVCELHLNQLAPVISQHTLFKAVCNALFSPVFSGIFKLQ